jgi:archaellum component FlaC
MRTYERLKNDIQTYENNIGFLSISSKGGGGVVKEMNRKIETLKEELELIVKKIDVIDENLGLEK